MTSHKIIETLSAANELIEKQQEEIKRLRLALALLEYCAPKKETRGRKRAIPKKIIDDLVKTEPTMKEIFFENGWHYSREQWVYIALREWQLTPSDHSAKRMQATVIKNMIAAKKIQK